MLMIIVDHLNWGPSLFHLVSGGGLLFASPAEGFFAISGILVGYIYGPRLKKTFMAASKRLWKRAFLLYTLSVVFTMVFTVIAIKANSSALPEVWSRSADGFLINTFSSRYSYGWADFLPRYAMLMAVAPFILWLIVKGKAWLVAGASLIGWLMFRETPLFLPFSSWQFIFIPAMIVGYYLPHIEALLKSLPDRLRNNLSLSLWVLAGVTFSLSILIQVGLPMIGVESPASRLSAETVRLFDKETIGVGRYLLGIVWFWALFTLARKHEQGINRLSHGVLNTIGQKSLLTYSVHAFVVFGLALWVIPPASVNPLLSTAFASLVLLSIYALVTSDGLSRWLEREYHKCLPLLIASYRHQSQSLNSA